MNAAHAARRSPFARGGASAISSKQTTQATEPGDSSTRYRSLGPVPAAIERALVITLALLGAAWALELQHYLPFAVFKEQYLALMILVALAGVFIRIKASRGEAAARVPWYDWLAAAASVLIGGYVLVNYRELVYDLGSLVTHRYVLATIAIALVLEAARRATGWTLVILGMAFIFYAKFSSLFPGILNVPDTDWRRLAIYLYLDGNGMLGLPIQVTTTIIVSFILFGRVLYAVHGDKVLTDFSLATMGRYRGGPAKTAVIASGLFGTISGSAVSNVVMDGPITIPMMKRNGYPGHLAAAIEAVASTGGQIMPPVMGITAFLIAEFMSVPYADVAIAAVIPAVLYYVSLFIQVDLEAAKLGIAGLRREDLPRISRIGFRGLVFVIPIGVLIYTLFAENWQPGRSAMAAVIATLLVAPLQPSTRPSLRGLLSAIEETGRSILDLVVITLVAGLVIGALQISGLSFNFSMVLISFSGESTLVLLLMTAIICIVLGMGMPTGIIYVMLAVLVAPALQKMGVVPMAAHLFLFYFGLMSMVTPPVCFATYAAASIAKADFWQSGWSGMRLAIVTYVVPFVMVYQPELVFAGSALDIVLVTAKTTVGILVMTIGMVGYLFRPIHGAARAAMCLFGLVLMLTPFGGGFASALIGTSLVAALLLSTREWRLRGAAA
jgi:TRAP transporter 4TM/12TM fusion protein